MPDYKKLKQLMGFDFGRVRTGIAVGHVQTMQATALTTLQSPKGKPDWIKIKNLIDEWKPDLLIVGLPLRKQGEESKMTTAAREFAQQLEIQFNLSVELFDERLSSMEAESQFKSLRKQGQLKAKDKIKLDAMAAQVILQGWIWEKITPQQNDNNG